MPRPPPLYSSHCTVWQKLWQQFARKNQTEQFVVASNALTYNPCALLDTALHNTATTHYTALQQQQQRQQKQLTELANNYTGASQA